MGIEQGGEQNRSSRINDVLREVGRMIKYAVSNPDKRQTPLAERAIPSYLPGVEADLNLDETGRPQGIEPSPVLQEVGEMIQFSLENPGSSQPPLGARGEVSQQEWEAMSGSEQSALRTSFFSGK